MFNKIFIIKYEIYSEKGEKKKKRKIVNYKSLMIYQIAFKCIYLNFKNTEYKFDVKINKFKMIDYDGYTKT